jgi:hypothetical protein
MFSRENQPPNHRKCGELLKNDSKFCRLVSFYLMIISPDFYFISAGDRVEKNGGEIFVIHVFKFELP